MTTTIGYDDHTGLQTTTKSGDSTVSTDYDAWGRADAYSDASGNSASSTYDAAGNVATFNDGGGNYTYAYDDHGILSSVNAGAGVGTFSYGYGTGGALASVTYPNGLVASRRYDEIGRPTGLSYTQGAADVADFAATYDVTGREFAAASPESTQAFGYDDLGRLKTVQDTRDGACTTRVYSFDASSNRSSFASYGADASGACQATTSDTSRLTSYDSAGRISDPGYTYDSLGRTLVVPQVDAGGGGGASALTTTYHANDMVASMGQSVVNSSGTTDAVSLTYGLDPAGRISIVKKKVNGAETSRLEYEYSSTDAYPTSVSSSSDGGTTWANTRYVSVPGVGMAAFLTGATTTFQIENLHGDIVASQDNATGNALLSGYAESDEYGVATEVNLGTSGWLGSGGRRGDALGGVAIMGVRLYNPATGTFLTSDPVLGGNVTNYTYPQDPVNESDPSGACAEDACVVEGSVIAVGAIIEYILVGLTVGVATYYVHKAIAACGGAYLCAVRIGAAVIPLPRVGAWAIRYKDYWYGVYEIYSKHGPFGLIHSTWKFGITRVGASRPESQIAACEADTGHGCGWKWKNDNVIGWFNARSLEAGYAIAYALRHGHCPPGMPRCL